MIAQLIREGNESASPGPRPARALSLPMLPFAKRSVKDDPHCKGFWQQNKSMSVREQLSESSTMLVTMVTRHKGSHFFEQTTSSGEKTGSVRWWRRYPHFRTVRFPYASIFAVFPDSSRVLVWSLCNQAAGVFRFVFFFSVDDVTAITAIIPVSIRPKPVKWCSKSTLF